MFLRCFIALEDQFGRLTCNLSLNCFAISARLHRKRLNDVQKCDLELRIRLALFHQELIGLFSQALVVGESVNECCFNLCYG